MSILLKNTPPTLQPLSFTSEPLVDLHIDLTTQPTMIHEQRRRPHKLTKPCPIPPPPPPSPPLVNHSSTLLFISENHLVSRSHQHRDHTQSDCGHDSPQRVQRRHSLLRNFSLRSRNSFTLRKSKKHQHDRQPPLASPSASRPQNVRNHSGSGSTASHSNGSSASLSMWKKWRVRSVSEHSSSLEEGEEAPIPGPHAQDHGAMSNPMTATRGPARKRSHFLRFVVPFQASSSSLSSSSQDDSIRVIPRSQQPQSLVPEPDAVQDAVRDEVDKKVNADNASSWSADGIVELIQLLDEWVDEKKVTQVQTRTKSDLVVLPTNQTLSLSTPFPPLSANLSILPTNLHLPDSPLPRLPSPSQNSSTSSEPDAGVKEEDEGLPLLVIAGSEGVIDCGAAVTFDSHPNLKSSISQKRRAKFTLGDESDLDSLHVSVPASSRITNVESTPVPEPTAALLNDSTQAIADMRSPPLMRLERLVDEPRDGIGTIYNSSAGTKTVATTNTSTRRWTLSSALTDEGISDEGLAKELERMREILEWDCTPSPIDMDEHESSFLPSPSPSSANPSSTWLTTQRALLTTRELILTERHYLSSLLLLLCPDATLTPVPEMMISHVKELVDVSKRLLKGMEGEPSARGVAEVFIDVGGYVGGGAESAFVDWCGVVGGWFQDGLAVSRETQVVVDIRKKRKRFESGGEERPFVSENEGLNSGSSSPTSTEHAHTSPLMRTVSTWRMSMPSISGLSAEGGVWRRDKEKERDKDEVDSHGHGHRGRMSSASSILMTSPSTGKPMRKPAVRDLAILPTQRVMRYVLLYRDLLANTPPSSSSYPVVERAVEVACRIAEKCDRAQGNAAFVAGSPGCGKSLNGSSNSMSNNCNNGSKSKRATMPAPSLKVKTVWGSTAHSTPSSPTTKSHFLPSSSTSVSPSQSLSKLPSTSLSPSPSPPSSSKPTPSSQPLPASPTKNRTVTKALASPSPPSSFPSKIPIARSGQSFGSLSTTFTGSSTSSSASLSSTPFSSSSAQFLPKSSSSRMPRSLSAASLMSLVNGFGRSVSGSAADVIVTAGS